MKKLILLIVILSITVFLKQYSFCQTPNSGITTKPLWDIQDIKSIAKKYDLQDSVSDRYKFLIYVNKNDIEGYFDDMAKVVKQRKTYNNYYSETSKIRDYKDYILLLEKYPEVKKDIIKSHGSEIQYNRYIKSALKYNWRIYRNQNGGLSFYRADTDIDKSELNRGRRIDNLPKIKE